MSPLSEARKRANKKWNDEHAAERYERLNLNLPKGKPEQIKEHARKQGLSTSGYINKLIEQDMKKKEPTD